MVGASADEDVPMVGCESRVHEDEGQIPYLHDGAVAPAAFLFSFSLLFAAEGDALADVRDARPMLPSLLHADRGQPQPVQGGEERHERRQARQVRGPRGARRPREGGRRPL